MKKVLFLLILVLATNSLSAQVGIGTTNPDATSALDIESTDSGLLIPRMTTAQRDNITTPAEGLQIYNTEKNTLDVFSDGNWKSFAYSRESNLVYVYSLDDLPTPNSGEITLDGTKMYVFSGAVNISPNYININGAGLRGTDPQKDQVISDVTGAVLRSTDKDIYIKELAVVPAGASTKGYDFSDSTGTHFCNIFSGSSVVDGGVASLGVGTISGFNAITILQNYWNTADGLKVDGNVGKLTLGYDFITNISNGAGVEITSTADIEDVDIGNNYFIYTGQTGIKVNSGSTVDRGRLATNLFRGVDTPLDGVTPSDIGWIMTDNSNIRDSKATGFVFFNDNTTVTSFTNTTTDFVKVQGTTTPSIAQKFTAGNNKLTYDGRRPIAVNVYASINASTGNDESFTLAIAKNGTVDTNAANNTVQQVGGTGPGNSGSDVFFVISLSTTIELETDDYIEVFIRSNDGTDDLTINGFQFSASE